MFRLLVSACYWNSLVNSSKQEGILLYFKNFAWGEPREHWRVRETSSDKFVLGKTQK